jgi:transcriptional regulator with XRE-family HTH domain
LKLVKKTAEIADEYAGNQVRIARRSIGMSQMVLAERLGVSFQQVQKYERALNRISVSMLVQIAAVLERDITYFFKGSLRTGEEGAPAGTYQIDAHGLWHYTYEGSGQINDAATAPCYSFFIGSVF